MRGRRSESVWSGENDEVVAALKVAVACRMIGEDDAELGLELANRVGAMLYRLIS